jgi:hypothetical protein
MGIVAILDDEPERLAIMEPLLCERFLQFEIRTFDSAPDMIGWLKHGVQKLVLICLDHDLGPNRMRDDDEFDPGTGRDVADYLATQTPTCPVIVHSTNGLAVPGMIRVLEEAGWTCGRIIPDSQLEWIEKWWFAEVLRQLPEELA